MDLRLSILVVVLGVGAGASAPADATIENGQPDQDATAARATFETLVQRYRQLADYEDSIAVVETVTREAEEPHRVETQLRCRIENDRLRIDSPGAQTRGGVGLGVPVARSNAMESLALRYNLWMAPHMALRFKEDPLAEFRLGVPQGFVVAGAEQATWRERQLMKLRLKAARTPDTDGEDTDRARYDLWVNPDSMLVERVTGRQTLPGGGDYSIAMDITPLRADGMPVASGD